MNDNKMTPLELRATWGARYGILTTHAGHVHGITGSDHLWYGTFRCQ